MLKNLEVPGLNDLDDASLHYVEVSFGVQQPWVGACVSPCLAHKYINNLAPYVWSLNVVMMLGHAFFACVASMYNVGGEKEPDIHGVILYFLLLCHHTETS